MTVLLCVLGVRTSSPLPRQHLQLPVSQQAESHKTISSPPPLQPGSASCVDWSTVSSADDTGGSVGSWRERRTLVLQTDQEGWIAQARMVAWATKLAYELDRTLVLGAVERSIHTAESETTPGWNELLDVAHMVQRHCVGPAATRKAVCTPEGVPAARFCPGSLPPGRSVLLAGGAYSAKRPWSVPPGVNPAGTVSAPDLAALVSRHGQQVLYLSGWYGEAERWYLLPTRTPYLEPSARAREVIGVIQAARPRRYLGVHLRMGDRCGDDVSSGWQSKYCDWASDALKVMAYIDAVAARHGTTWTFLATDDRNTSRQQLYARHGYLGLDALFKRHGAGMARPAKTWAGALDYFMLGGAETVLNLGMSTWTESLWLGVHPDRGEKCSEPLAAMNRQVWRKHKIPVLPCTILRRDPDAAAQAAASLTGRPLTFDRKRFYTYG